MSPLPSVRLCLCVLALGAFVLTACGDDEPDATADTQPTTTQTTDGETDFPCAAERTDCTSEEVVATMEQLYAIGGATEAEAACLAPITGEGKTAVSQATEAPTEAETEAAIECVGSEQRLREIVQGVAGYFESLPIVEDDRCDPAAEVLDDDEYALVSVLSDLDVGTGPSDSVTCMFGVVEPPANPGENKPPRTFEVSASGEVTEQ